MIRALEGIVQAHGIADLEYEVCVEIFGIDGESHRLLSRRGIRAGIVTEYSRDLSISKSAVGGVSQYRAGSAHFHRGGEFNVGVGPVRGISRGIVDRQYLRRGIVEFRRLRVPGADRNNFIARNDVVHSVNAVDRHEHIRNHRGSSFRHIGRCERELIVGGYIAGHFRPVKPAVGGIIILLYAGRNKSRHVEIVKHFPCPTRGNAVRPLTHRSGLVQGRLYPCDSYNVRYASRIHHGAGLVVAYGIDHRMRPDRRGRRGDRRALGAEFPIRHGAGTEAVDRSGNGERGFVELRPAGKRLGDLAGGSVRRRILYEYRFETHVRIFINLVRRSQVIRGRNVIY